MSETGKPGRYTRSTNGLIAALVVTLLAVLAFVAWRALFREELEIRPEPYDYLGAAAAAHEAGVPVIYPAELPADWMATRVQLTSGGTPEWGISMLTDDERFVGLRQYDGTGEATLERLLEQLVDDNPEPGESVEVEGSVATTWQTWSDDGGDSAFSAEVDGWTVVVYGSAPVEDQRVVLEQLTDRPPR